MKILTTEHKNILYEFRLLERTRVVQVMKAGIHYYTLKWSVGLFICDCPGAKYHRKCWHPTVIGQLKSMPSVTEPWAEWAEEAEEMKGESKRCKNKVIRLC